jgi:hypothetical protein
VVRQGLIGALLLALFCTIIPHPALATSEAPSSGQDVLLAGLYSDQWQSGADLEGLARASGKRVSLTGTFHHLHESEEGWEGTTDYLLEQAWSAQTTPVANLEVKVSAAAIASGIHDAEIAQWASRVKGWLDKGGGRSLLIAPMQEMNTSWVPYGMDPAGFRTGYRRIVEIFRGLAIDETEVRWVFAPNGWSKAPYRMSDYYPGDDVVDLVGVSGYNFGSQVGRWSSVYEAVGGALAEIRSFAPLKPYLIAQVGSSTAGGDRDAWIRDLFQLASRDSNVVGVVYFNFMKETDWKLWDGADLAAGWRDGMQMATTVHAWPLSGWFKPGPLAFTPHRGTFIDDDRLPLQEEIEWMARRGITQGCDLQRFCPYQPATREQVASFLVRALRVPSSSTDHFTDDDGSSHEPDNNALFAAGIVVGCAPQQFCPGHFVTRQQVAVILARALDLPPAAPDRFADAQGYEADIGAVAAAGISQGCDVDRFCPWAAVNRQQMAAFLRRSIAHILANLPVTSPFSGRLGYFTF